MFIIPTKQDLEQLERDAHVAKLIDSIASKKEKIHAIQDNLESLNIIEEHVEVKGEPMILFSVDGKENGVAVAVADIESGKMSRNDAYLALADMVEV